MKALYPQAIADEKVKRFLPDSTQKSKPLDRQFFFNILNSVYPKFVKELVEHASKQRHQPEQDETKKDYILISDDWYKKFMQHPFISSKTCFYF